MLTPLPIGPTVAVPALAATVAQSRQRYAQKAGKITQHIVGGVQSGQALVDVLHAKISDPIGQGIVASRQLLEGIRDKITRWAEGQIALRLGDAIGIGVTPGVPPSPVIQPGYRGPNNRGLDRDGNSPAPLPQGPPILPGVRHGGLREIPHGRTASGSAGQIQPAGSPPTGGGSAGDTGGCDLSKIPNPLSYHSCPNGDPGYLWQPGDTPGWYCTGQGYPCTPDNPVPVHAEYLGSDSTGRVYVYSQPYPTLRDLLLAPTGCYYPQGCTAAPPPPGEPPPTTPPPTPPPTKPPPTDDCQKVRLCDFPCDVGIDSRFFSDPCSQEIRDEFDNWLGAPQQLASRAGSLEELVNAVASNYPDLGQIFIESPGGPASGSSALPS